MATIGIATSLILLLNIFAPTAHLMKTPHFWDDSSNDINEMLIPMEDLTACFNELSSSSESSYIFVFEDTIFPKIINYIISSQNNLFNKIIEVIKIRSLSHYYVENIFLKDVLCQTDLDQYAFLSNILNNQPDFIDGLQSESLHTILLEIKHAAITPQALSCIFDIGEDEIRDKFSYILNHAINNQIVKVIPLLTQTDITTNISHKTLETLIQAAQQLTDSSEKNEIINAIKRLST